jgi:hypothetical protein
MDLYTAEKLVTYKQAQLRAEAKEAQLRAEAEQAALDAAWAGRLIEHLSSSRAIRTTGRLVRRGATQLWKGGIRLTAYLTA